MTGDPLEPLDGFISARLNGDATLVSLLGGTGRIWQALAPEGLTGPVVTFDLMSATLNNVIGSGSQGRIMVRPLYLIKAITPGNSFALAASIADRIDKVLVGVSGSVPSANLFIGGFWQEEPVRFTEITPQGVRFDHQGARYRTVLSAIS